jgi:hypothetical protein
MTTVLPATTVKQLAFVRMLYQQGIEQSRQPEPLSAMSILTLHDAVEFFLGLASLHLGANAKDRIEFIDYWPTLEPHLPAGTQLTSKTAMLRLNKARVGFKHHGNIPSASTIEQSRVAVTSFFMDNTPTVFGVDFNLLDMTAMIVQNIPRQHAETAQVHAAADRYLDAAVELHLAFKALLKDYADRKRGGKAGGPFSFVSNMSKHFPSKLKRRGEHGARLPSDPELAEFWLPSTGGSNSWAKR